MHTAHDGTPKVQKGCSKRFKWWCFQVVSCLLWLQDSIWMTHWCGLPSLILEMLLKDSRFAVILKRKSPVTFLQINHTLSPFFRFLTCRTYKKDKIYPFWSYVLAISIWKQHKMLNMMHQIKLPITWCSNYSYRNDRSCTDGSVYSNSNKGVQRWTVTVLSGAVGFSLLVRHACPSCMHAMPAHTSVNSIHACA